MRKFRGQEAGKHVALQLFNHHRGQWIIRQRVSNKPAIAFWNKTVPDYTNNTFDSAIKLDQEFGVVY